MFKTPLKKAFDQMEENMMRNIAYDIFQLVVHEGMTDAELTLYYGGGVDRFALIEDTERKLDGDQRLLKFYQDNKQLFNEYGDKDIFGSFSDIARRDALQATRSEGNGQSAEQSRSGQDSEGSDGRKDDADQGGNSEGNSSEEHGSGIIAGGTTGGDQGDDRGGEGESTTTEENGGGKITLTIPEESEARRLEIARIEREVGTIEKTDGNEVTVIKF